MIFVLISIYLSNLPITHRMFVNLSQTGLVCSSLLKGNELNRYRDVKDITTSFSLKGGFYLTTHSTHLRLYGVIHMVKDHSDS